MFLDTISESTPNIKINYLYERVRFAGEVYNKQFTVLLTKIFVSNLLKMKVLRMLE